MYSDTAVSMLNVRAKNMKSRIAAKFDIAASVYDYKAHVQQDIAQECIAAFGNIQSKPCNVLVDLGCGTAKAEQTLSQYTKRYIGLDLSHNMLKQALKHVGDQNHSLQNDTKMHAWFQADAEQLPFQDASIDAYYSSMALQWCTSAQRVLSELYRTLKAEGNATLAIMVDGSFSSLEQAWKQLNLPSRVNKFGKADDWLKAAETFNWHCSHYVKTFETQHTSLISMLKSIKSVGANTKSATDERVNESQDDKHAFISRCEINAIEACLKQMNSAHAFHLSYKVLFLTIQK